MQDGFWLTLQIPSLNVWQQEQRGDFRVRSRVWLSSLVGFFCIASGWLSTIQAAQVSDLYTAQILVAEQSVKADPSLVAKAMRQVIVKVSGRKDVVTHPQIKAALADPERFTQQFSYQNTAIPMQTADGREVVAQQLRIDFIPELIDQLLDDAHVRPLGASRPGILLWIVEERGGQREYLGRDEDPVFASMLNKAEERGLPIFRPMMDLEDEQALPVSDAWGFFADSIRKASARYQSDAVLVGRIYRDNGGRWKSQWQLVWPQDVLSFDGNGASLELQLASAVEAAADRLFADFVKPSSGFDEGGIEMQIEGVAGLDDYFQIVNYLSELPAIRELKIQALHDDLLVLRLAVDGSLKQVQSSIALNQRFKSQLDFSGGEMDSATLIYYWQE